MKKKVLASLLVAAMAASVMAVPAVSAEEFDYGSGEITIWVADAMVDMTKELAEGFIADKGVDYTIKVEAVGEGDAAKNMLTDVTAGADIFTFAQDQMARLVTASAVQRLNTAASEFVTASNDAGSIAAATAGEQLYAFPITSDNGYFMYYDKSVVTDPTSLEQILADCEAAGKSFYFDLDSAWYNASFFFATGCECTFDTDNDGNFTAANVNYASDAGVVAMRAMGTVTASSSFVDGSSVDSATNIGAIIDGVWDSEPAKAALGDNYACAPLPNFVGSDGNTYHLSGFGGYKLLGVKPQTEGGKMKLCYELAQYLSDTDAQLKRYEVAGWGPSNLVAQQDEAIQADPALSALAEQLADCIPQGQYPGEWWDMAGALGADMETGTLTKDSSDDDILAALQSHDDTCAGYIQ